jgi:hypothetical protein
MCSVSGLGARLEDINGSGRVSASEDSYLLMAKSADSCILLQSSLIAEHKMPGIDTNRVRRRFYLRYRPRA